MRLNIGEKYIGTITEIKPFGAVIQFKDESTQMLHISHISDTFVQNIEWIVQRSLGKFLYLCNRVR